MVSVDCPVCNNFVETIDRAIFRCNAAMAVWKVVALWCNVENLFLWDFDDLLSQETLNKSSASDRKR